MNGPECPKCNEATFIDHDGRSVCPECGGDYDTAFLTEFTRSQEAPTSHERRAWQQPRRREMQEVGG